ncbi:protein FAR-RED IMPAIRED RESPONSE 1-like [Salvia miltiorrhiza]|uniref:protein FAR-RED IMPAIRED RESPONSE 1-like n=1 Tax=Salvia miltiorrhiza TaxID=226208 RepID=UPI0025AB6746|nr:protein FAR-RED IMPAIRED RESPONSE 1-like [Salvia miltiorrhiza]
MEQNEDDALEVLCLNEEEQMEVESQEIDMRAINDMLQNGPQSRMEFQSRECLFAAYQEYAKHKGFSVSTRNVQKEKYLMISCDRGRKPNVIKHLSNNMKRQLEARDMAGIRVCKNIRLLEVLAGGPSSLGASVKDCRNFIDQRRRLRLAEGDAAAIYNLFKRLQQQDRNFFHLMDLDDDNRLRNVMWIHPRSRAAYEEFHDVVSFDTTYLVNQYNMPFGTVVGVNHHNQSILLGCALFTNEHAESFKWFFTNWLDAMEGVQPTTILTDQCESIRIALREVMPDSINRFCLWHIVSKTNSDSDFNSMLYHSLSMDEFESRCDEFLTEHSLHNNKWLKDLYGER